MLSPDPATVLDRLRSYLSEAIQTNRLVLSRSTRDGRVDSQENERQISQALEYFSLSNEWFRKNLLALEVAPPRYWYDFSIKGPNGLFLPVNVKVSALKTADNISSKEGLFYALTGVQPVGRSINSWESFCQSLSGLLNSDPSADYYFLVIGKSSPGEVFWTSLKKVQELVPNGNNPPFQCHWGRNKVRSERGDAEAQQYILRTLRETFRLRSEALNSFDRHLSDHI